LRLILAETESSLCHVYEILGTPIGAHQAGRGVRVGSQQQPANVFVTDQFPQGAPSHTWDVSPDGQHLLMTKFGDRTPNPVTEIILVQNWFEELGRLAPAKK